MALQTATIKNTLANAYAAAAKFAALYTSAPAGTPGNEVAGGAYARKAITWTSAVNGLVTATVTFDVPIGTVLRGAGVHSATTLGYLDGWTVTEQTFSSEGKYTLALSYQQN